MKIARAALALLAVVAAACTDPAAPASTASPANGDAMNAVQQKLNARVAAVRDYTIEATAKDLTTGVETKFTYTFSQPQFARVDIAAAPGTASPAPAGPAQTVAFDGSALVALDHGSKTAARMDKSIGEDNLLFAIYRAFSDYACEGWRPPLIRPKTTKAVPSADGQGFTLTVPIDDPQLKEERVVLRGDGSFVEKSTVDAGGNAVAFTRVKEDLVDPATGLTFPKRWEKKGASGHFDVVVTKATVNAGVTPDSFNTNVPDGYAIANKGTP